MPRSCWKHSRPQQSSATSRGGRDSVFKNRLARLASSVRRALLEPAIRGDFAHAGPARLDSERNASLIVDNIPGLVALLTVSGNVEMGS